MAYTRFLYPKLNFALTHCTGMIDDHQLMIYIMSFHAESKAFGYIRELVDLRPLHSLDRLTAKGLVNVADKHKALFAGRDFRRAVLNRAGQFNRVSEIYSMLLSEEIKMKVFDGTLDEPLAWLGYDRDERVRLKRFVDGHSKGNRSQR